MNVVVQIYMIVCVVLLVFDVAFLMVKNARNQRFYPKKPKFRRKILVRGVFVCLTGGFPYILA